MAETIVGEVVYGARFNLPQLIADSKKADKIVKDSYDRANKLQSKGGSRGNTKSPASADTSILDSTTRAIEEAKRSAKESYDSIAKYTPQIQGQFLTVERANNQVFNATNRSTAAIQKYGQGSVQADAATKSLNTSVQNQSIQQAKLTSMLNGTWKSQQSFNHGMEESITTLGGVTAGLITLGSTYQVLRNGVTAANQFQASMTGLARLSQRFGYSADEATTAAKELSQDGIVTVTTAASGLQKLLTAGVGLPEAIKLMQGYKDQAAFGRSSTIDLDTAVNNLAESFYTENSAIGNLSGQTENWTQILEYGARAMGKSVSALTDKERIQAKLIGQQRLNNLVEGDAAVYAETNAGKQARLNATLKQMEVTIGQVTNSLTSGLIGALAGLDREQQKAYISAGAGAAAFLTVATLAPVVVKAFKAIRTSIMAVGVANAFASAGITALVGGLVGLAAAAGVNALIDGLDESAGASGETADNVKQVEGGLGGAASNAQSLGKQLAKINDQMEQAREDFQYSLAQLVAQKNENIAQLTQQLKQESDAYDNAYRERLATFNKSENDQQLIHQKKVTKIQNQIDYLTKYNSAQNKQQLTDLQFALARENDEHAKSTTLRQEEFSKETESAKSEYEVRRQENQKKLEEELALLNRHREDVLGIRNVILLDEIDSLKKSRDEQLKSLQEQKNDIVGQMTSAYDQAGKSAAQAFNKAFGAEGIFFDKPTKYSVQNIGGKKYVTPEFDTGGFTGRGGQQDVAGIVHKGEYVLPKSMVNQSTGLPKMESFNGSRSGTTDVLKLQVEVTGDSFKSEAEKSRFADMIIETVNRKRRAKSLPELGAIA